MSAFLSSSARRSVTFLPALLLSVALASAQTRVTPHSNSFTPAQDVELGQQAAAEVRKQMPLLDDQTVDTYVEEIGRRLVAATPSDLQHPEFRYTFDVVNVKEINAFALPGGPMFLHRGMIEAAHSEGEVAGVMAHELSHVMLRHGTAQATKAQKFQIGAVAGQILGSIIGGTAGSVIAQGSQFGLGTYFLKYSREYEREADIVGAQLMARSGYDPREMANMFKTIEEQGGSRGPQFLSDHPNPGNRVQYINEEAKSLRIEGSPPPPAAFSSIQARLRQMPSAMTSEQVARAQQQGTPTGTSGRTAVRVEPPSSQIQTYTVGSFLRIGVPANWREIQQNNTVTYAPQGAYFQSRSGQTAFTHGLEIGVVPGQARNLRDSTEQLIRGFVQSNPQLRQQGGTKEESIGGRSGLTTTLTNVSNVTGATEHVTLSTVQLRDGSLLYLIGVAPRDEAGAYQNAFKRARQSLQIADQAVAGR